MRHLVSLTAAGTVCIIARNGGFASSPLIGTYCGRTIDPYIRSHSNRIYLKFVSNAVVSNHGFYIRYDGTTSGTRSPTAGSWDEPDFCHVTIQEVEQVEHRTFVGL